MKIGDRDIVHTSSLIIPGGKDAWIEFNIGSWLVKVNVIFKDSDEEDKSGSIVIEAVEDYAKVTFFGWNNSLGSATVKPVNLGKTNEGQQLAFMATHWLVGSVNRLDMQFLLGGEE